jgi:hypothetical protein
MDPKHLARIGTNGQQAFQGVLDRREQMKPRMRVLAEVLNGG